MTHNFFYAYKFSTQKNVFFLDILLDTTIISMFFLSFSSSNNSLVSIYTLGGGERLKDCETVQQT